MAGTLITVKNTGTMPITAAKCLIEIKAPANQALILRAIDFTEAGVDSTDAHSVITSTVGGTATDGTAGSAPTVTHGDPEQGLTIQTAARGNFSAADITNTGEVQGPYAGQSPCRLGLPPWRGYVRIKQGTCFRVYGLAEAANPYTIVALVEE